MTKLKITAFILLSCALGVLPEEQVNEAQSKIDHFLKPPSVQVSIQQSQTLAPPVTPEDQSFVSKLANWFFPFGESKEKTDLEPSETQQRYAPQYLPPPHLSQGYPKQSCNPCNKEPWIPVVSSHGHNTVIGFMQPSNLGANGHLSPSNSYGAPSFSNIQNLHPPSVASQYGPPSPQYGAPKPQYGPPPPQYGPPPSHHGPSSSQHGPSSSHHGPSSSQHGPSSTHHGPPPSHHGPPSSNLGPLPSHHGPPSSNYGPPPPNHGAPSFYGPPSLQPGPPLTQYGPPSSQYGPPGHQHGQSISHQERPPPPIHPQYGVPKDQYGLPTNIKPNFGPPPDNFKLPPQYFTPPPSKHGFSFKFGPPKQVFPPVKLGNGQKLGPAKFKQHPLAHHGPPIPLNFGKSHSEKHKHANPPLSVESVPSLSVEIKPPNANAHAATNYAPVRTKYNNGPLITPNYHTSHSLVATNQHSSQRPTNFVTPSLPVPGPNIDHKHLSNSHIPNYNQNNLRILNKPIPFPELSLSQVAPLHNAQPFQNSFSSSNNFSPHGAKVHSTKGESAHDIQLIPSIRVADYLASIEHPINVIQSPLVEVTAVDTDPTKIVEPIRDYGNNNVQLSENPIIVDSHEDDTHAAATAQNTSYQNLIQNQNLNKNKGSGSSFRFNNQNLATTLPPFLTDVLNSDFSSHDFKTNSFVEQHPPQPIPIQNSGINSNAYLKVDSSVQKTPSFVYANSGISNEGSTLGQSIQNPPISSFGISSSSFSNEGPKFDSTVKLPFTSSLGIANFDDPKEGLKAEPSIQQPVPTSLSFTGSDSKLNSGNQELSEDSVVTGFLNQFIKTDFSQSADSNIKDIKQQPSGGVESQPLFTQPPMDYSNWTPTFGLSTSMVPPPLGEPVWFTPTAAVQPITTTTPKPKQVQIIIPYTSNGPLAPLQTNTKVSKPETNGIRSSKVQQSPALDVPKTSSNPSLPLYTLPPPPSKTSVWSHYTTDYYKEGSKKDTATASTKKPAISNIRDLLLKEEQKSDVDLKNLPFDIVRLQKNIDDWTEQEYSNSILGLQNPSTSGKLVPSKNIPSAYLTTQPYNASADEITTIRTPTEAFFDHEPAGSDTKISQVESDEDIDTNFIITETTPHSTPTTEATTVTVTTITTSTIINSTTTASTTESNSLTNNSDASSTTKSSLVGSALRTLWEKLQVSVSPLTKEKIYVVTPQPWRVTPREINEKLLISATEPSNIGHTSAKFSVVIRPDVKNRTEKHENGLHIVYSEWPHLINNLITTTTTAKPKTTKHALFGLMDLSSYTPPPNSTVETYGGHSRVITVVTPTSVTKKKITGLTEKKTTTKSTTPLFSTVK